MCFQCKTLCRPHEARQCPWCAKYLCKPHCGNYLVVPELGETNDPNRTKDVICQACLSSLREARGGLADVQQATLLQLAMSDEAALRMFYRAIETCKRSPGRRHPDYTAAILATARLLFKVTRLGIVFTTCSSR
jgi:ribosomal protein S27E